MKLTWNADRTVTITDKKNPKKITGTRFAAIFGLNPYTTPFAAWCDITKAYDFPFESTIYTDAGIAIEPHQADYVEETFVPHIIRPVDKYGEDYFNQTHGNFFTDEHFGGMWDYLGCDENGEVNAVFEMKTTGKKKRYMWADGKVPEYYALQAALYAYLLGVDQVHMVASFLDRDDYEFPADYVPDEDNTIITSFKVSERYPNFKEEYVDKALEWWYNYVDTGISPVYENVDLELVDTIKQLNTQEETMDIGKITELITQAETDVAYINEIVDKTVASYTSALDNIMGDVKRDIVDVENPSLDTLEKYFLLLSNCLYFISERTEKVGIYDSITKINLQESYNNKYLENQSVSTSPGVKKPTVAESTAKAENATIYESVVNDIYNKSYRIIKSKIDAAQTMISTISKVISRRMSEQNLSNMQPSNIPDRVLLNE